MDTLTIEIKNPNARKLIDDLADLDLISILKTTTWTERWQTLSATLPHVTDISENDVLDEIQAYRTKKSNPTI